MVAGSEANSVPMTVTGTSLPGGAAVPSSEALHCVVRTVTLRPSSAPLAKKMLAMARRDIVCFSTTLVSETLMV